MLKKVYTEEENNWLRKNYSMISGSQKLVSAFEAEFGRRVNPTTLRSYCNETLGLRKEKRGNFTKEENAWFKNFYPQHGSDETVVEFEKVFGRKITRHQVICHCNKIGVFTDNHYYSKKEEEWLKNNWNKYKTPKSAYQAFCKVFGKNHSVHNLKVKVSSMGIKLDKLFYSKEEEKWIKENYPRSDLSVKEIYTLYCAEFGDFAKSFEGFRTYAKKCGFINDERKGILRAGTSKWYAKKREELGLSSHEVLSEFEVGSGKFLVIDKDIYNKIKPYLCKGEITETMVEIQKAKNSIILYK